MDERLNNLRRAYHELSNRVNIALRTQVGDTQRLNEVRAQAVSLGAAADQVGPHVIVDHWHVCLTVLILL